MQIKQTAPRRRALYAGDTAGQAHLKSTGIEAIPYQGAALSSNQVLVVGPQGGQQLAGSAPMIANSLKAGGNLLAIGLEDSEANTFLPFKMTMKRAEHIAACFEPGTEGSLLAGVGSADVHNRDPRVVPLVSSGATVIGDGVLAVVPGSNVVFCQLPPWQFEGQQSNLRRTYRRSSFLLNRLLANLGVAGSTPILTRFHEPLSADKPEQRWKEGLYMDQPEEWDDPYRFFRW
jgi:hypothetical protein